MTDRCYSRRRQIIRACWQPAASLVVLVFIVVLPWVSSATELSADEAQQWRAQNADFDWQQSEGTQVRIVGRGAGDNEGNLYFVGTKTYADAQGDFIDDSNMFVARINADNSLGWRKEFGTNETDGANFVAVLNESIAGVVTQFLYVVGWTWGFMDEGGHALNDFGRFGGRDVVLMKVRLDDGRKLWARQFGTTADDMGYGVQRDGGFDTLLLTGVSTSDQVDAVIEMDVDVQNEPRQKPFSLYETQLMDARARQDAHTLSRYQFAVSLKRTGEIVDFAMDGGVTISPRRQRIAENSSLVGEYAVVLNRQPLDNVTVTATIVCLRDPGDNGWFVQQLAFVSSPTIERTLVFTPISWNREQLVRVVAVDDATAEGVHYAVITHTMSSRDPHFHGAYSPFLYGRNITMQIDDNDMAGIQLSRRHVFVGEGGLADTYEVGLRSRPLYPVTVTIVSLHASQAVATPSVLTFEPSEWNIPQVITVTAVDDDLSENEYSGLHFGGRLLHYSDSNDRRYRTGRPKCYDVQRCDPQHATTCLSEDATKETIRVCDLTAVYCGGRLGNGACIAEKAPGTIPAKRFGAAPLFDSEANSGSDESLSYTAIRALFTDQADDAARVSPATNISVKYPFRYPPPRLRGFVLSFLGLLNLGQAVQLHNDFRASLQAVCNGLDRLVTHDWATERWPNQEFPRVLNATLTMFGGSVTERHLWQCGMASFLPGSSSINISIWDNDPGVTLSTRVLKVSETDDPSASNAVARYTIVLNAPPSPHQPTLQKSYCSTLDSDNCGLWSNFTAIASSVYKASEQSLLPNVTIVVISGSQVSISPAYVTFTSANWFVPQWVSVRAANDDFAEDGVTNVMITHRVQDTTVGYSDGSTAFWFRNSSADMASFFSRWSNSPEVAKPPYNYLPCAVHSPQHRRINVQVQDDDFAGVIVSELQPFNQVKTRESDDAGDDWVGDVVRSFAFSEISLANKAPGSSAAGIGIALSSVLVFEKDAVTFMKFHLPERHEGDTHPSFSFARVRIYETPFKVINASSDAAEKSAAPSAAFDVTYDIQVTVVDNAWSTSGVENGSANPAAVQFLGGNHTIRVSALLTKQRSVSIDVSPLMSALLPTRLPVVSLRIQVLGSTSGGVTMAATTQLCSSLFERALRPTLSIGYAFPSRLLNGRATQSSTAAVAAASLAVNGNRADAAATNEAIEPWWEVTLPALTRLGSLAIFVPPKMNVDVSLVVVLVATLVPLNGQTLQLLEASKFGCPAACPLVQRIPVRKALIITELNAGVRSLRLYREGTGALQLKEVEAYDPHIVLTPTANGVGLRARLKPDWNGRLRSNSWRLLQSVRQSDDENVARGMRTQQSSTAPSQAVSALAVDGQHRSAWDQMVRTSNSTADTTTVAGSTRTEAQTDPWWEVDLGSNVPIARVELYPFVGQSGRGYCEATPDAALKAPSWASDLVSFSKMDPLLQIEDPFQQLFQVTLSDASLSSGGSVIATKTLQFSCAGSVLSIPWTDVFAKARFVTVKRPGVDVVLMLNEVVVTRWNPATTPQFVLVDLRGKGDLPLALSSIQLFAPTDAATPSSFAVPIAYSIHSASSQRSTTGAGSTASLLSVAGSDCYVAAQASYREWIVLKLAKPTHVGLIDLQTNVDMCGSGVSPVFAVSVSARGLALDGLRSPSVEEALATTPPTGCSLTALGTLSSPSSSAACVTFTCEDVHCRAARTSMDSIVFSDFNDIVIFGMPSLVPTTRLPLSQHETRAMLLRDNPVMLWAFDTEPRAAVTTTRTTGVYELISLSVSKSLQIDDDLEQSFFSNAVAVQPAMSAFSVELWIQFTSAAPAAATVVTLTTQSEGVIADIKWSAEAPNGVFTVRDPGSGGSCFAKLSPSSSVFDVVGRWYHVAASYDPSNARLALSVRFRTGRFSQDVALASSTATCSLPLLSARHKAVQIGAFTTSNTGFAGYTTNVAWYVDVLTDRQLLDHFHDFFHRGTYAPRHNSYALRLSSRPLTPVTVEVNAETACYSFGLCNVTALPRVILFTPENWNVSRNVLVLATDDQLYEGLHHASIVHNVSSLPTFELQSTVFTEDLVGANTDKWMQYRGAVNVFDRAAVYTTQSAAFVAEKQVILDEIQANWSTQQVASAFVARDPYREYLPIRTVDIVIEDATVPGIQFSTSSLVVSEQGKGNDYQILLLSTPKSDVLVTLNTQSDCYRDCLATPSMCPSQAGVDPELSCGGGSAGAKLCNITVSPSVLVFTPTNWSFPQTVRVVAIDDLLDEADVHLSTIKATSQSLDPIYDALFLPDIVVAVEDNDNSTILYSTLAVAMKEKDSIGTQYGLSLLTEPWANVTIAMSNEADRSCYRRCGYPFDGKDCGLPRQQTVTTIRLASKSPREIHEIALRLPRPRVMEVQRIATYADHVDHVYTVQATGGFAPDIQILEFVFNSAFKARYTSAAAVTTAGVYIKSFNIGFSGKATQTAALDGFASASQVETAINGLIVGRTSTDSIVRVSRELRYDAAESLLRWQVTFLRFVADDLTFPLLTVTADTPFEGSLVAKRVATAAAPSGMLVFQYGKSNLTSVATFPLLATKSEIEGQLRHIDTVFTALLSRRIVSTPLYGMIFTVTFTSVDTYETLKVSTSGLVAATASLAPDIQVVVTEVRVPVQIGGYFVVQYDSPYINTSVNATIRPRQTAALPWNTSAEALASELARLHGLGNVSVSRRQLTPEGGMDWTIGFVNNNGNLSMLQTKSLNLTGKGAGVQTTVMVDGVSVDGTYRVGMGGTIIKTDPVSQRVYTVFLDKKNTTSLPFNVSAKALAHRLASLKITERPNVTRVGLDCDGFDVCEGYVWTISYIDSAGNLPPIQVHGTNDTLKGSGAVVAARTVANGTYLTGSFSLELELVDPATNLTHRGHTWNLPVNVSGPGMDQALEAIRFVRSNREAEYDSETQLSRGMKFDKGVRVFREGPYLDGGYTWRLEWAIEDYVRFQDLRITINTSLVTQLIEPLVVPSEHDLTGTPRCSAIPMARFQADSADPFRLRGFCVYDLANVTTQERFLCNYTVKNPWIVFTPSDWCSPQPVVLAPVDDFIDEATTQNGNLTYSNVTHTVFSDDLVYSALPLQQIRVAVENDDVATVLVSESHLDVSEGGAVVAYYELLLTTEPLYDVKIVVLPWLDSADTKCYRFGHCNVTLPVDTFVFSPQNWNIPQRVVVQATDDKLDEFDFHDTGISHVSYSADLKYHQRADIPKIHVTVTDNDNSAFFVNKLSVNVTEDGPDDVYDVVLGSEPFAKVTVEIQNVGTKGNYATTIPSRLVFTWLTWNQPQTVRVAAVNDDTEDPLDSSSVLVHSITTNDLIYANIKPLGSVRVWIRDNDVSGIELSDLAMAVKERARPYTYKLRLMSEPWFPVVVSPSGANNCYVRAATQERVCNASVITTALTFGASNWSQWQAVSFLAFDDALEETPVHAATIVHASSSRDLLYVSKDYIAKRLTLSITDNDQSFVNISLAVSNTTTRSRLHVAEGGFNDSYTIVLKSEPYENVVVTVTPRVEQIVSVDTAITPFDAAQVGTALGSRLSSFASGSILVVFTPQDWSTPRVVTVFGIDDQIAEDPTQFSAITHRVQSADAKYNVSNASLGIVDVAVIISDREAIPPPLPISSLFDATGTRVVIRFDSPVYHADTMLVRTGASTGSSYALRFPSFACSLVFSSSLTSLGTASSCAWQSDLKQLVVTLGSGATVLPSDVLLLYECASFVNQVCQSSNVLRARHTSRAYTQATIKLAVDPATVPTPKVVLNVPEQVGTCGTWRADASLSSGSIGRAFKDQWWMVLPRTAVVATTSVTNDIWLNTSRTLYGVLDPLCAKYDNALPSTLNKTDLTSQLSSFITTLEQLRSLCYVRSVATAASAVAAVQIQLNSSQLLADTTYIIGLSLVNAFSQQTATVQAVKVGMLPSPVVFAVGESMLEVSRGDSALPIVLRADATLSCPLLAGAQLSFRWFATLADTDGSKPAVSVNLNATNTARDPQVFRVPRPQLQAGKTYHFRVEASAPQAASTSAFFTVRVVSSPLVAVIGGGNRSIGEKDALVLNASLSLDPDQDPWPLEYAWRCEDWTNETMAAAAVIPCANASSLSSAAVTLPTASSLPMLTIDPFTLAPQRILRFFLTVRKASVGKIVRNATIQTTVWTAAGSVPEVTIQASATRLNPSSRLILNAAVKSTYPYMVRWLEDQGDLGLPNEGSNVTTHDAFTMALTSPTNAIHRNWLTPGQRYVLRLLAVDINGNRGFTVVSFDVNAPPSPGLFQISPHDGVAMVDAFSLECLHWADDVQDLPLRYSFGLLSTATFESLAMNASLIRQRMQPLVSDQLLPTASVTMLPPEARIDDSNMTVVAFITDASGSSSMAFDVITIRLPKQAATQPLVFASLLANQSTVNTAAQAKNLLSAALVIQRTMDSATSSSECRGTGSSAGICSGHGTCDVKTLVCACEAAFIGPLCQFTIVELRDINVVILSSLASSIVQTLEPSSSGLSQQALVVDTLVQSSPAAFDADALAQVTRLTSTIAQNGFALQDAADFFDATASTLLKSLSTVLAVSESAASVTSSAASTPAPASRRSRRRLAGDSPQNDVTTASATAVAATSCADESASARESFRQLVATLQALAAVASQELLPDELPVRLASGQITTTAGAGSRLNVASSSLSVNLTSAAIECLDAGDSTELFLSAFELTAATHPRCLLQDASTISSATIVAVHSKAALVAALAGTTDGVVTPLALSSDNFCVAQTVARDAAAGKATVRRLVAASDSAIAAAKSATPWYPLVALSLPHTRALSAIEQRNFTTGCRAWNALHRVWERNVCFKDDVQSSMDHTVCYCSELRGAPGLEVLVTLEERLDFYALSHDLYRDDEPSVVGPISLVVIIALFVAGGKYGQFLDRVDDKRDKEKIITNLNRSKWSELKQRIEANASGTEVVEDFATFLTKRQQQQQKKATNEASPITAATSDTHLVATIASDALREMVEDDSGEIPNEVRVLFGSSVRLECQYGRLTLLLRSANAVLFLIGVVGAFVGIDFYLVLGNSTSSELVLFLYGKPIGLVLVVFGGGLVLLGLWGTVLAKANTESSARIVRSAYASLLLVCLVGELFFVLLAFRYVHDLEDLPLAGLDALRAAWDAVSPPIQDEIQHAYGCCGFTSIAQSASGCPEEALDAMPPRTCVKVIELHARTLFETSLIFLEMIFLIQVAAVLLTQTLRTWRRLRLNQLVDSSTFAPSSGVEIALICSVPPVVQCLLGLMVLVLFAGIDLLAQLHVLSNAVFAGLLGVEVGVIYIVVGVMYALVLLQGLYAIRRRDATRLQSFAALATACLLVTIVLAVCIDRFHDHWLLDPAVVDFVHAKYMQLTRDTLVDIETSLECCGFASSADGACVASTNLPTCRNNVLRVLHHELGRLRGCLVAFTGIQSAVLVLAIVASVRIKRFTPRIQPLAAAAIVAPAPFVLASFSHALVYHSSAVVLTGCSAIACVFGLVVIGAGVDVLYQLNVLHLSMLLRVFDRHVAVYLLVAGGAITLFGVLGIGVAWMSPSERQRRRLALALVGVSVAIFVAAFGFAGFSYRTAHVPLNDEALDERLEVFWLTTPPTTTRVFLQNVLTCCGYDKIERTNGTTVFTDAGELSAWRLDSYAVETDTYVATTTTMPSATNQRQRRRLSVKLAMPRRLTQVVCPTQATEPCGPRLKTYVQRVASRTFQLSVAVLAGVCSIVAAVGGLVWHPELASTPRPSWEVTVAKSLLLVLSGASVFVALASLFLGLDIVSHWSLFSSTALQLVFPQSMGVAFFLYAAFVAFLNIYTVQGVVHAVVHRTFLQSLGRVFLILCGFLCVGLSGYVSHYGGTTWADRLSAYLSRQWDTLTPLTQHRLSLEFQCCGFDDPVVVQGKGIVFDRPAVGFACSPAAARGCRHVMETQIGVSLAWVFVFVLALSLVESVALVCSLRVLAHLRRLKPHDWFVIESRMRFAIGTYKSNVRKTHVLLSLTSRFDRKLTRVQRLTSVACGFTTTLAIYATWFARHGCHRLALKTCRQPDAWTYLGMGLVYGGLVGFTAQLLALTLFETVRNRSDDETSEVTATRQRKEKSLLFHGSFSRWHTRPFSDIKDAAVANGATVEALAHSTTEERWYAWLARFTQSLFCVMAVLLFLFGCGLATYMTLVLLGVNDSFYGLQFDQGPRETLLVGVLLAATALLAWLAIDLKQRGTTRSVIMFVAVAVAAALLLAALCLGVFMASQTLEEDPTNWTIRNINFSVPARLRAAWTSDTSGFFRNRVQQQLQCCGFFNGTDAAMRPCPDGTTLTVQFEAVRVDGRVVTESKDELHDRTGCYAAMLTQFHILLDHVASVAAAAGVALVLLAICALFLAHDVAISKDAKLQLRVATATSASNADVRATFEKVVGVKIAAPARGKIFSKLLSNSLENVAPHVVHELAAESLARTLPSSDSSTITLPNGQIVSSSLTTNRWDAEAAAAIAKAHSVPYPAWITRIVFALSSVWIAAMGYVVLSQTLELGVTTAWRCVAAWGAGVGFHLVVVEPLVVFLRIVMSTLSQWWANTLLARLLRFGRAAITRIRPSADALAAQNYASLSLYERIRFNAAVRIQRRLATRLARRRFLQTIRDRREQSHRQLVAHRRRVLAQAIEGFTAEEIEAFRLLFEAADTARLGLVSYEVIAQSIYQLGVRVDAARVRAFLLALDPAYADLVDFEHFLYGMHRVRVFHQEKEKETETETLTEATAGTKEEFVSASSRFGPRADPQARVLVKRQNLMRELREKRESLSYRLLSKVNRLPPLLQRGLSATRPATATGATEERSIVDTFVNEDAAVPTGAFVVQQNRKLSPTKRALEMVLKKKSRDDKDKSKAAPVKAPSPSRSPRKMVMPSLRLPGSPRARSNTSRGEEVDDTVEIPAIEEGDETDSPSPHKTAGSASGDAAEETKPFGTFMLLVKDTASAGKHKVLENIRHKQNEEHKEAAEDDSDENDEGDKGEGRAIASEPALPTAADTKRSQNLASTSLQKALEKKKAAMTATKR